MKTCLFVGGLEVYDISITYKVGGNNLNPNP